MMKTTLTDWFKRIAKYPVTVWMLTSFFAFFTVVIVYAAYNGTVDVKRVVSTQASSNVVFSSNYMETGELVVKGLRTTADGNFICNVTVCNYDQLNLGNPAHSPITYDFTAELMRFDIESEQYVRVDSIQEKMDGTGAKTFYVQKIMDDNVKIDTDKTHDINAGPFTYTYPGERLEGETSNKDSYDICFDSEEVKMEIAELFIRVSAVPTPESVQLNGGVPSLSSIISVSQGRSIETGWHGSLNESSTLDYDGYNLIVEGTGKGTIDILWDSREFTISPAFIEINSSKLTNEASTDTEGWKKVRLTVNSTEENRYVVQFYKKKTNESYSGTNFASKYIKCENYIVQADPETPAQP